MLHFKKFRGLIVFCCLAVALIPGVSQARLDPDPHGVDPLSVVPSGFSPEVVAYGDLLGTGTDQIAVLALGAPQLGERGAEADVFAYDDSAERWTQVASFPVAGYQAGGMFIAPLTGDGRQELVVSTVAGSGGFLSYQVFGWDASGQPQILLERDAIFQGQVEPRPNGLLERRSDQTWLYTWNGGEFVGQQVTISAPAPVGTEMLHYRVTPTAVEGRATVTLRLGQQLRLVRDDQAEDSTRILYGTGVLEPLGFPNFRAAQVGTTSIDIIPRGYDWEHELKVIVEVTP